MATTLTGANQKTEWWDLRGVSSTLCFTLTGTFSTAVSIHYSNEDAFDKESNYRAGSATYSAATGPLELPFGIARWVRFASSGSWTGGTTCVPGFARAKGPNGEPFDIPTQGTGA